MWRYEFFSSSPIIKKEKVPEGEVAQQHKKVTFPSVCQNCVVFQLCPTKQYMLKQLHSLSFYVQTLGWTDTGDHHKTGHYQYLVHKIASI